METIEIVVSTDHRFIMPSGVMMYSVCRNNLDVKVCFHVIVDESVTEEDKADLRDVAKGQDVRFYDVDSSVFSNLPILPGLSPATYYRLLIPQILPEDIHRVLYLDGDIIVRNSLLPLWQTNIDGYALAAVTDADESLIEKYNRQNYLPIYGHFNAGVLLMNLKYWRTNNIRNEIKSYIENHYKSIRYCDQDILNYVLKDKKITLPIKYNTQTQFLFVLDQVSYDYWKYESEVLEAWKDPVIIHYNICLGKPWMEGSIHPFKSSFIKYQNETKWKGVVWMRPKRPFITKVLCHTNDIILKALLKMRVLKIKMRPEETRSFLNLAPVD